MNSPTLNRIAEAYQVSRQRLHKMRGRFNLAPADFVNPEKVFQVLLEKGATSPLRDRLADPAHREQIRHQLQ